MPAGFDYKGFIEGYELHVGMTTMKYRKSVQIRLISCG